MVLDQSPSLDRVFHALAHPARRAILRQLSSERERNLSELSAPLKMSFPAASKHVRVLEKARLVRRRVEGRSHLCRMDIEPLRDVTEWMEKFREQWEARFVALDNLLAEMQGKEPAGPEREDRRGSRSRREVRHGRGK